MLVRYDPEADALYVELRDPEGAVRTERVDERRLVDYGVDGQPAGVELLFVSHGVDLRGLPHADEIREAIRSLSELAVA